MDTFDDIQQSTDNTFNGIEYTFMPSKEEFHRSIEPTDDEKIVIPWISSNELPMNTTLYSDSMLSLTKDDMMSLQGKAEITDNIVSAFGRYLNNRELDTARANKRTIKRYNFSVDFTTIAAGQCEYSEEPLTAEDVISIFNAEFKPSYYGDDNSQILQANEYFFPFCRHGHWVLFVVEIPRKRVFYFNSLNPVDSWPNDSKIFARTWHNFRVAAKYLHESDRWDGKFVAILPPYVRQPDSVSCGVFTMSYMHYWSSCMLTRMLKALPTKKYIIMKRRMVTVQLLLSPDNERRDFVLNEARNNPKANKPKGKKKKSTV